ncbi:hypothetical protein [Ekhidna sp.]|uniref:hypothetical protein n=1 Tax=Ekhidna sp. TaxID=2608089 RepID=UPI003299A1DE
MKKTLSVTILLCFAFISSAQFESKVVGNTYAIEIKDGVCYFNGLKIGDKQEDVEARLGKTQLVSQVSEKNISLTSLYYPDYGLEFTLEGDYVRVILLYPKAGSVMGDIQKFKIFSRNQNNWRLTKLPLNKALPQDIMMEMGTESINTKLGSGFTSAISNNVMGYKLINSGGTQDIIFYFDSNDYVIEHIANRLSK